MYFLKVKILWHLGVFLPIFQNKANFLRLVSFDDKHEIWWNLYIQNQHENLILFMYLLDSKFCLLEFRLLLSRVAPYYSSLPQTFWNVSIQ